MKGGAGLLLLVVALVGGYILFGDSISGLLGGTGTQLDPGQVDVPGANEVADGARGGADAAADEVSSWTPETWKIIVLLLASLGATFMWFRSPKFRWAAIGVLAALLAVVAFA